MAEQGTSQFTMFSVLIGYNFTSPRVINTSWNNPHNEGLKNGTYCYKQAQYE